MLTYIKKTTDGYSYTDIEVQKLVDKIKSEEMKNLLFSFRSHYPVVTGQNAKREYEDEYNFIPQVCFAARIKKQRKKLAVREFNSLCLLEVNNLASAAEAEELKAVAVRIPFTRLCFIGASRRSVKIVCAFCTPKSDEALSEERMKQFQMNAFKMLHYHYSSQLGLCVDYLEPTLERSCLVSYDEHVYYNPESEPYYVSDGAIDVPEYRGDESVKSTSFLPEYSDIMILHEIYEWCMRDALGTAREQTENREEMLLTSISLLADYCNDSNLPLPFGIRMTTLKYLYRSIPKNHIERVFENAYAEKLSANTPFGHIEKSALLTYRTEAFLKAHYELRRNVMTGVVQYLPKDGFSFEWRDMDQSVMDSMTNRALRAGLGSWDKDMRRIINSDDVPRYEPLADYLSGLPAWDGKDRVTDFVARIPSTNPRTQYFCRIWMVSMVAHWLGKDSKHGNSLVPLLIGGQGCGKTSFANIVLPPELANYYHDKVNFKNETDLSLGLTSFALINIDEFDSLKKSQQPTLKYLISKNDVKLRPPYGKAFVSRPRYASFIATTNNLRPLVDRTGSRRFICIRIPDGQYIDYASPVDYEQLYAQLVHEVYHGVRYWLDNEETAELMAHNESFQNIADLSSMIDYIFSLPSPNREGKQYYIDEILEEIASNFSNFSRTDTSNEKLGRILVSKGYEKVKKTKGNAYIMVHK